jgi:predicted Zn-dependent protease with MMP-like domain
MSASRVRRELDRAWSRLEEGDATGAVELIRALLSSGPLSPAAEADARHLLGQALEELGDTEGAVSEWLVVQRLDTALDDPEPLMPPDEFERVAEAALAELPREVLDWLANVPVLIDDRPSPALVSDGLDPRILGLFTGVPAPNQSVFAGAQTGVIHLFQRNLEAETESVEELKAEIRVTVLHETAHYFGFDDDQLRRLGLG